MSWILFIFFHIFFNITNIFDSILHILQNFTYLKYFTYFTMFHSVSQYFTVFHSVSRYTYQDRLVATERWGFWLCQWGSVLFRRILIRRRLGLGLGTRTCSDSSILTRLEAPPLAANWPCHCCQCQWPATGGPGSGAGRVPFGKWHLIWACLFLDNNRGVYNLCRYVCRAGVLFVRPGTPLNSPCQ